MDFDAVITSTRRDRDSDILESSGATVDPNAVLLWQHIPMLPIGRLLAVTEQSDSRIKARLSIADTELGRDAATLAEFGALKISHGFEPVEFEPLPDRGWHIKRFEIYEISLVSVPSNRDAVITAFSRDKLRSPLLKQWASAFHHARSVQGVGTSFQRNTESEQKHPCECRCANSGASRIAEKDALSSAGAKWLARAIRSQQHDLPALRKLHGAVGQIIARLETEQQLAQTQELLRQLGP